MANKTMTRHLIILLFLVSCSKLRIQPLYNNTILLDFDGYNMANDFWNQGQPVNLEGSGMSLSDQNEVVKFVKNMYKPFLVNITTNETLYNITDPFHRMRIVITNSSGWYNGYSVKIIRGSKTNRTGILQEDSVMNGAGGVAFLNSFKWGLDVPCFVFSDVLLYKAEYIAKACCHEGGHTLGLRHQVDSCAGWLAHGRIMGNPYDTDAVFVHNGLNDICQTVDEFDKIGEVTGWR